MPQIKVEIAYARPDAQSIVVVEVDEGATVEQAITLSRIKEHYPEIDLAKNKVGLFGKLSKLTQVLKEMDRVEIYRPLIADPKEVRRKRAAEGKRMSKGGGESKEEASPS